MGRRVRYTIGMRFNIQWEEVNIPLVLLDSLPNARGSLIFHGQNSNEWGFTILCVGGSIYHERELNNP
jgi:hypothetical protein